MATNMPPNQGKYWWGI